MSSKRHVKKKHTKRCCGRSTGSPSPIFTCRRSLLSRRNVANSVTAINGSDARAASYTRGCWTQLKPLSLQRIFHITYTHAFTFGHSCFFFVSSVSVLSAKNNRTGECAVLSQSSQRAWWLSLPATRRFKLLRAPATAWMKQLITTTLNTGSSARILIVGAPRRLSVS